MEGPIAFISIAIASVSLIVSIYSTRTSRKALNLSEQQYKDGLSSFHVDCQQGRRLINKEKNSVNKILLFEVTIRNKSKSENTLESTLEIRYFREDATTAKVLVSHDPNLKTPKIDHLNLFPSNINIQPKSIQKKWLAFQQPAHLAGENKIDNYNIKITDVDDNVQFCEINLIKNITE